MRILRLSLYVALAFAALYLVWTFAGRRMATREWERSIKARQAPAYTAYPGTEGVAGVKILQFYAMPGVLHAGERSSMCYGVVNAKTVRIEPEVEPIEPSLNRCLQISPRHDTRYTLTAEGADGKIVTASFVIKVEPKRR
jgi:hypothetical protein